MKQIILILAICYFQNTYAQPYQYPIKPGSEAWAKLETHEEMLNVTQIPEGIIDKMSTKDLLTSCLEYPMLPEVYAHNNLKDGLSQIIKGFNGLQRFKQRPDAGITLLSFYKTVDPKQIDAISGLEKKGSFTTKMSTWEILLGEEEILNQLSITHKKDLLRELMKKNSSKDFTYFGGLGTYTISYTAARILTKLEDPSWKSYLEVNKSAKLFEERMALTDPQIVKEILSTSERLLKK